MTPISKEQISKYSKSLKDFFWMVSYRFLSFLGLMYRSVFFKNIYFLDTNFLIIKTYDNDGRFRSLNMWSKNLAVTTPIKTEMQGLLARGDFNKKCHYPLEEISFEKFYQTYPGVCPVYHNFIGAMHNPALITSIDFPLQTIFSKITKGKKLTTEEDKLHAGIMSKLLLKNKSVIEEEDDELSKALGEAYSKSIKKRKDGLRGKNKNYPNDIRNLSLIYIYAILNKKNVTFLTSDSDAIAYFFDWIAAVSQHMVFNMRCLEQLALDNGKGMREVVNGRKKAIFFDTVWMFKEVQGTTNKTYSNHGKYFSPRLSIKYWDKKRQKFFKVGLNISDDFRNLLWWNHGSLNCPTAKNDIMGAFLKYKYWWPPQSTHGSKDFKIIPLVKSICRAPQWIPSEVHDLICRYRRADLSSNYGEFSSFTD